MTDVSSERRKHRRYRAHFAVSVDAGERTARAGVSQNVSVEGLLFNSRSRFAAGEEITVTLLLRDTLEDATRVKAKVVRVQTAGARTNLPWRHMTAVRFDGPVPEIESRAKLRSALPA
jgi:hypothetical protein